MDKVAITSSIAACIAALAACFAAWYAARSTKIARRAYRLAMEQDQRNQPSLDLYLVNSYIKRIENADERLFVFRLLITNKSASRNSIKSIQLLIAHQKGDGPPSKVSIPHNANSINEVPNSEDAFEVPLVIEHYSVAGGLAIFRVPNELIRGSVVETYLVKIIDFTNNETELEAILLSEKNDEKAA